MRTLKKVLALSLVFAMAFTMMAGAAFKDQDKIDSSLTSDIQLLTALGVFKGDENGNFNPTDNVRRSEAAKMIYVLKNNGVDDGAVAFQGVSKYSDVPVGHWAEGYINYCTNLGYMGGWKENGVQKFDPNGNVTGVELMKMLLCMIGYKADVQGYTGNGWQTNVLVDAATSGLSVNFTPSVYGATPRQWTARLMVNALNAYWVSYTKGELTYQGNTYAQQYMKLYSATGTLIETQTNAIDATATDTVKTDSKYSVIDNVKYSNSNETVNNPVQFEYAVSNELLGQEVRVYFRGNSTTENVLGTSNKVYGVTATGDQKVINTTLDAVKFDDNYATNKKVTIEGLGTKAYTNNHDTNFKWYVNYHEQGNTTMDTQKASGVLGTNSTLPVKIIADKDGYVKSFMVTGELVYGVVTKLDAENGVFEMKNGTEATASLVKLNGLDDKAISFNKANKDNYAKYLNVASDVKVGDVVQCLATVDGGLKWNVTKATVLGAATGYTLNDKGGYKTIKVDGTDYKLSARPMNGYNWDDAANNNHGSDKVFYTDGKYVVFSTGSQSVIGVDNLAYLINVGEKEDIYGNTTKVYKVMTADGTITEYDVSDEDGLKATTSNKASKVEKVYSYSVDSKGKLILKPIATGEQGGIDFVQGGEEGAGKYVKATSSANFSKQSPPSNTSYRVDENSVFFTKKTTASGTEYVILKGNELADGQELRGYFAHKTVNGYDTMVYGVISAVTSETSTVPYAVAGDASYVGKVDDNYVNTLNITTSTGEAATISFKYTTEALAKAGLKDKLVGYKNKVVEYTVEDNYVTKIDVITAKNDYSNDSWNLGALTAYDGTTAVVGGKFVKVASDIAITYVNKDGDTLKASEDQTVALAGKVLDGEGNEVSPVQYNKNVIVKVSVDGNKVVTIEKMIVEVDGDDLTGVCISK